ncbi:MAG: AAA family ATPase [Candidatus Marinimicrobia bacterium]|nr:AAA family ATPase [Candidatus Neomarinimicrobiota bacterium]
MERIIDRYLEEWKGKKDRKVLLVRGARQVGKTYSIRELGKKFNNFIEVNFEADLPIRKFFDSSLDPIEIIEKLSIYYGQKIEAGKTLLFFDEIQACPNALRSLRFFYEKLPDLHVIGAGSLLEFALSQIPSFGVGRIHSLFMYPMNFKEFLLASNSSEYINIINKAKANKIVDTVFHNKILDKLKLFILIGGMPEVVKTYIKTDSFLECQKILENLITTIFDDFGKYKEKFNKFDLQEIFNSIILQTGQKFKYSKIGKGKNEKYKKNLELLMDSGMIYKVYHTSASGLPLGGQIKQNKFKMLLFDTGIYQVAQGMDLKTYLTDTFSEIINRGNLTELFVGLELIKAQSLSLRPQLFYWHREAKSSNAEVDFVISQNGKIYPIEVKSGTKGQMQSMNIFLNKKESQFGIRISQENFSEYDNIKVFPLYAVENIFR